MTKVGLTCDVFFRRMIAARHRTCVHVPAKAVVRNLRARAPSWQKLCVREKKRKRSGFIQHTALPVRQCLKRRSREAFQRMLALSGQRSGSEVPRERVHVNLQAAAAARTEQQPHAHELFLTDAHASQLVPSAVGARQHHEARPAKC